MAIIKVVKAGKTKASLKSALNYIANEEKITTITGKKLITPLNCWGSLKNIYDTMIATKELYRKAIDNRNSEMYKHFQQSFKPNEITPEKAHEIGKKWAMQNFAQDGFEVCICTHLDTEHIHNHFIINSVNAITGKTIEIHANKTLEKLKYSSDELCREYKLSVIERDIFAQNKNHEYNMRKKYSFLREQFRDLTWQKTVYDKIIAILNKSRNKDFKYFEQELLKVGIKLEHERLKKDFIFNYIDENRKVSDKTLAKTFHDDKILRSNIEMIWGKTLQYDLDKKIYLSEKKQGFYNLIENLIKIIDNINKLNIKTKIEFYIFMEKQGWLIKETQTGKAFYNQEHDRYLYDNTIYKILENKAYCLKYIEQNLM